MEEWKTYKLGDVCKIYGRIGFRGYTIEDLVEDSEKGAISLSPTNIQGGVLDLSKPTYISWEKYYESPEIMIHENDIVIVKTGSSIGRTAIIRNITHPMTLNPQLVVLKDVSINKHFLGYLVKGKDFQGKLSSIVVGSAIPTLSQKNLANLTIAIPPTRVQEKIANILSSLDSKIELNNRINHNLEEQAQALYKSWFVDFEPFKDGKFIESELGMIPEGWRVVTMGEVTTEIRTKVGNRTGIKVLSPINTGKLALSEEYFTKQVFSNSIAKYILVEPNNFAYNPARVNIGSIGMNEFPFDGCVSPVYVVFRCEDEYEYLFDFFRKGERFKTEVITRSIGGVRQTLAYKDFSMIKMVYPPAHIIRNFNSIYHTFYRKINDLENQNKKISELRDSILPKLMSGELEINEIDC